MRKIKIEVARKARKVTIQQMCDALKISKGTYLRCEKDPARFFVTQAYIISCVLHMGVDELDFSESV